MSSLKAGEKHPMFGKTGEKPIFREKNFEETRAKMSSSKTGNKNSMCPEGFGKLHKETKKKKLVTLLKERNITILENRQLKK